MNLVSSKNHRNQTLKKLIDKIQFNKITIMGSIGCKIASIIRGECDIYISLSLPDNGCPKDWDFAAPEALIKSAGGAITNLYNENLIYNKLNFEQRGIIIASGNIDTHEMVCLQIQEIFSQLDICLK